VIAAEGLAAAGRMIAACRRRDGAATDFKIAWVTVTLRDLEGHRRCLGSGGSRVSAVVTDVAGNVVRRAQPGYVTAPASLLALAAWRSGNGAVQAWPTRLRPVAREPCAAAARRP